MDHQESPVRAHRHHLERAARLVITHEHQPLLPTCLSRQHRLRHRVRKNLPDPRSPDPVLARRLGELDQHSTILHDTMDGVYGVLGMVVS